MINILAPIWNENVCPHWSERWEVRSRPLGCHVSTITFLTAIVAFLVGLVTVGIVVSGWKFGSWAREKWRGREQGWWRGWRLKLVDVVDARRDENGEARRPLLEG